MNENDLEYGKVGIPLQNLWKMVVSQKLFIVVFTLLITLVTAVYMFFKNPIPIYSGHVMVEIGTAVHNNSKIFFFDQSFVLKQIIENLYSVKVKSSKKMRNIIILTSTNTSKNKIKKDLKKVLEYIIKRHKDKTKLATKYIMTKQIGKVTISNNPINTPKKKLIVFLFFITGLISSVFVAFFLTFLMKNNS